MDHYVYAIMGISCFLLGAVIFTVCEKRRVNTFKQKYHISTMEVNRLRNILHAVILMQEANNRRVGASLHRDVASLLSCLRLAIDRLAMQSEDDAGAFLQFKSLIDRISGSVSGLSYELSPLMRGYTLSDALFDYSEKIRKTEGVSVSVNCLSGADLVALDEFTSINTYRILTELIGNVIRQGHSKELSITLSLEKRMYSIIFSGSADAIGAFVGHEPKKAALQQIEGRLELIGGRCRVRKAEDKGMQINIFFPVQPKAHR